MTSSKHDYTNYDQLAQKFDIDPFIKRLKLVHNGRFLNLEVLYCSQNIVKSIKIQSDLS